MHLPQPGQRRLVELVRQVREQDAYGGRCGDAVDQRDRVDLGVAEEDIGELDRHLAQQPGRLLRGQPFQRLVVAGQFVEAVQPPAGDARTHRAVLCHAGQRGDRGGQVIGAVQPGAAGELGVAGGPVRRPRASSSRLEPRGLVGGGVQAAYRVRGADEAVGQTGEQAREQARPPADQHLAPVRPGQFADEEPLPVPGTVEAPERGAPGGLVRGVQGEARGGRLVVLHRGPVAPYPPGDFVLLPEQGQGLGAHRAVVGEVHALPALVPEVVHLFQGFVDRVAVADRRHGNFTFRTFDCCGYGRRCRPGAVGAARVPRR